MKGLLSPYRTVCLVGNAKNAGKTTVLNAVLSAFAGARTGVSSIGLDGEEVDVLSRLPKPRIHLPRGCLVATAEGCLPGCSIGRKTLRRTGIPTALGEVLILEVTEPGHCLVGGPSAVAQLRGLVQALLREGAEKVLIDGAFARSSHAAAAEALVFVVGAQRFPDMHRVVESAGIALKRLSIPAAEPALGFLGGVTSPGWLDVSGEYHPIRAGSPIGDADILLDGVPCEARYIYLPRAAGQQFVRRFVQRRGDHRCGLILKDALALVAEDEALDALFRMGRPLRVLRPLRIAFLAANPVAPAGWRFDRTAFLRALRSITPLPVMDVLECGGDDGQEQA